MIANINNFGVVNFYENGTSAPKKEQAQPANVEEITPVEETAPANETAPKKEQAYTPPIPREGDYNGVRMYIEERFLTKEFGWFVDDKSLGRNIQRNI